VVAGREEIGGELNRDFIHVIVGCGEHGGCRLELLGRLRASGKESAARRAEAYSGSGLGIEDVVGLQVGLDPERDAGSNVCPDIGGQCSLGPLGGHDQMQAKRAADGRDAHQFAERFGGVVHEHAELVDDNDQVGKGTIPGGWCFPVGGKVRNLCSGEDLLTKPDFGRK
jgi:hypothetical protein